MLATQRSASQPPLCAVVGVIGPYNSGCATLAMPAASSAPDGPLGVVSPSNNYVGLTAPAR